MKKRLAVSIAMTTFWFVSIGEVADLPRYQVSVGVTCDDERTKALIERYIKRELHALGDVDIVEDPKDVFYFLLVVATKVHNETGREIGTAFAFCYYVRHHVIELANSELVGAKKWGYSPPKLGIRIGPSKALDESCTELLAAFNRDVLSPMRSVGVLLNQNELIPHEGD